MFKSIGRAIGSAAKGVGSVVSGAVKGVGSIVKPVGNFLLGSAHDVLQFGAPFIPGIGVVAGNAGAEALRMLGVKGNVDKVVQSLSGKTATEQMQILESEGVPLNVLQQLYGNVRGDGWSVEVGTGQRGVTTETALIIGGAVLAGVLILNNNRR